ncbi:hypothetical protein KPL40_13180 [Clostridium gasigenes]|uniref:hypothetical protein n=1 Tax=Clostridium gasigenes TaxID=94869 RepID=UPI001C0C64B4|nr:hypothetical protein [Clostridium gasigenes]MBU3133405.1 hypothetical protein [Clostridium gasigenes]
MFQVISNLSSLVTLFLFLLYIIGRIWTINKNKKLSFEDFKLDYSVNDNLDRRNQYELSGDELITIKSSQGLNWIEVYEVYFDNKKNEVGLKSKKPVISHKLLNINEEMYIKTYVPCGIPCYRIIYQRFDYIVESFDIGMDGKYGGLYKNNFSRKLTLKSYLYYLCK